MKFDISAFTHSGTVRDTNEDSILVNGALMHKDELHLVDQTKCFCFVADGVGGNKAGEYASNFVLTKINQIDDYHFIDIESYLKNTNDELINIALSDPALTGTATTLSGIVIGEKEFKIIHSGDSQIWLLRNEIFFKVTHDHVLDNDIDNSPITSYFGGGGNHLKLENNLAVREGIGEDLFLICTDGLFKSINKKMVKSTLQTSETVANKIKKILIDCLEAGADDNVSVIIIKIY